MPNEWRTSNSSVLRQNNESQSGGDRKTKHAKFSEKLTLLTSRYAHVRSLFEKTGILFSKYLRFELALLPYHRPIWQSPLYLLLRKMHPFYQHHLQIQSTVLYLLLLCLSNYHVYEKNATEWLQNENFIWQKSKTNYCQGRRVSGGTSFSN